MSYTRTPLLPTPHVSAIVFGLRPAGRVLDCCKRAGNRSAHRQLVQESRRARTAPHSLGATPCSTHPSKPPRTPQLATSLLHTQVEDRRAPSSGRMSHLAPAPLSQTSAARKPDLPRGPRRSRLRPEFHVIAVILLQDLGVFGMAHARSDLFEGGLHRHALMDDTPVAVAEQIANFWQQAGMFVTHTSPEQHDETPPTSATSRTYSRRPSVAISSKRTPAGSGSPEAASATAHASQPATRPLEADPQQ